MAARKRRNPFYVVLLVVGAVFAVTACAYGVMTVRGLDAASVSEEAQQATLLTFLDAYGFAVMIVELILLAICTFAAILTDEYWVDRGDVNGVDDDGSDD